VALVAKGGIRQEDETPRFLHRRSEHGYTSDPTRAMRLEPEAVGVADQERQTKEAHERDGRRQADAWKVASDAIKAALEPLRGVRLDRGVVSSIRAINRTREQLDQKLHVSR
jgi:hypothetical protein